MARSPSAALRARRARSTRRGRSPASPWCPTGTSRKTSFRSPGKRAEPPSGGREPDLTPVNGYEVLEKLAALPVSTWNYIADGGSVWHLGPIALDFKAAFGLGESDKVINMVDANGVVMVAIQALYRKVQALEAEVEALRAERAEPAERDAEEAGR